MSGEPPAGWEAWNEEPGGRLVWVFRPDVFDGGDYPPECLPTIAVAPGRGPDQRPERRARSAAWYRACYLEPTVRIREADATYDSRPEAIEGATSLAEAFSAGDLDFRAAYQQPRPEYLAKLDELTGAEG